MSAYDPRAPRSTNAWVESARARLAQGEWSDALICARKALEVEPASLEAQRLLAEVYACAPREPSAAVVTPTLDALDTLDRAPVDAMSLVAVHAPEDLGIELISLHGLEASPSKELEVNTLDVDVVYSGERLAASTTPRPESGPLPHIALFAGLPRASLSEVAHRAERRTFEPGEALVDLGDALDAGLIVLQGRVEWGVLRGGRRVVGGEVAPGEMLGDVEVLTGRPSGVFAVARTAVEVLRVDTASLSFLRQHYPAFERALQHVCEEHGVLRLLTASVLFEVLSPTERAALARRVRPIALSPGEELFAAGADPGGVYLVTDGTLEVYAAGLPATTVTAGAVAGLSATLERRVAWATVLAGAAAQVVCLDTDELDALLAASPALNDALWQMATAQRGLD